MQSNALVPAFHITNSTSTENSFKKVKNAIDEHDYEKVIQLALDTIRTIKRSQLTAAYDHRVYGLVQQYKYDAAIQDIEKMIEYHPDSGINYVKLADVLDIQGKQEKVYQVCDQALKKPNISVNDPFYTQLVKLKNAADQKCRRRIDPLTVLPIKLYGRIFALLKSSDRMTLMHVSPLWRQRVLQCENAWEVVDNIQYPRPKILGVLPHVAKHVKNMTLCTDEGYLLSRYFELIEDGMFTKLESLTLKVHNLKTKNMAMSLTNTLWKIRNTLTSLFLEVPSCTNPVQIDHVLYYCRNLKVLGFSAFRGSISSTLDNLEHLEDSYPSLIDLQLFAPPTITGQSLKSLVRRCPNLRRLVLGIKWLADDAIDVILDDCPNLEVLCYHHERNDSDILLSLDDLNTNNNSNSNSNNSNKCNCITKDLLSSSSATTINPRQSIDNNVVGKLRILSTPTQNSNSPGVPASQFVRLLQNNQKSLERIYANMSMTKEQDMRGEPHAFISYIGVDALTFDRLEHLSYVADIYGVMEKLFLNSIKLSHSSLKLFEAVDSYNIPTIADTLIKIPPVQELKFFYRSYKAQHYTFQYYFGDEDQQPQQYDVIAEQSLVRLFKSYASSCNNSLLSFPDILNGDKSTSVLKTVAFDACTFISDKVLNALAEIKTLKVLSFKDIVTGNKVTTQGFKSFLNKLGQNAKITVLKLNNTNEVINKHNADDILRFIGKNMAWLDTLHLEYLDHITYQGVNDMVDAMKEKRLRYLNISECAETEEFEEKVEFHIKEYHPHVNLEIFYDFSFGLFD